MSKIPYLLFVTTTSQFLGIPIQAGQLSWPQWQGPTRNSMIAQDSQWPSSISKDQLKLNWRKELEQGYPGPVVSDKLVFTVESKGKGEIARAFDRKTGEQAWEHEWNGSMSVPFFAMKNGSWVRSTPAFDGKNLYIGGMRDYLVCLDSASGEKKWSVNFMERYDSPLPSFGLVCSPLVVGDHVYIQAGAGFVKLEKETGKSVWQTLKDQGGMHGSAFSSPIMAKLAENEQLVVQSRTTLAGVNPETGKILWEEKIKAYRGMNILTPVIHGNSLLTSSYGGTTLKFDLKNAGQGLSLEKKWENPQQGYMSAPIIIGDHCYLHLRKQRMTCLDMITGETKWISEKSFGKYMSMVSNGKEILALDEDGTLYRIEPNTEKLVIKESREISKSPTWGHIAISDNQIFIRELKAIACYEW